MKNSNNGKTGVKEENQTAPSLSVVQAFVEAAWACMFGKSRIETCETSKTGTVKNDHTKQLYEKPMADTEQKLDAKQDAVPTTVAVVCDQVDLPGSASSIPSTESDEARQQRLDAAIGQAMEEVEYADFVPASSGVPRTGNYLYCKDELVFHSQVFVTQIDPTTPPCLVYFDAVEDQMMPVTTSDVDGWYRIPGEFE